MRRKRGGRRAKTGEAANRVEITPAQGLKETPEHSANSGKPQSDSTIRQVFGFALIFCATLAAYFPALNGSLLWDDNSHITAPDLASFHGLWRIWTEAGATQQYYPLLHSAFWLEHRIWGDAFAGYHLTNIVLHVFSACMVVLIARRLSLPGAWLAGFVFALHPVNVEAVAWMSEQKSTLSGAFCLAALLAYLHFDRDRRKSQYALATFLFVLALLSKTVTATLPAVLLVIFWWERGRLSWKRDVLPLVPWFALGMSAGIFTAWFEKTVIGAQGSDFILTPVQRFLIAGRVICFYAGKLFWPADLTFSYPHWNVSAGVWWQWLFPAGVLAAGIGLVLVARRHRGPLAGFLIFCGTLFPVLGFLNVYPFRFSYVADHFQYLASLGIIVPVTSELVRRTERHFSGKNATICLSAALILIPGVLTWRQSRMYRDSETLYRETLARNPESWMAHNNLGLLKALQPGGLPGAIAEYRATLRIKPDFAEAHYNLGNALSHTPGGLPEAIAEYETAIRIGPDSPVVHNGLGNALVQIPGRLPDAIAEFQTAIRMDQDYAEAHNNLGTALEQIPGRQQDAVAEYRTALRIKPDFADAHNNLGMLLVQTPGELPNAIAEYQAALQIDPDYAEAHFNLGIAYARIPERQQEAIAEYQAALRIRPDFVEAYNDLGNALLHMPGQIPAAIAEYQAGLRIAPDSPFLHNNLGIALAQIPGRLQDAIAEYKVALRIKPDYADARYDLGRALEQIPGRQQEANAELQAAQRIRQDQAARIGDHASSTQ